MSEITQFEEVIRTLALGRVQFVLIGGVAMRLHGAAHLTDDVNICYDRDPMDLGKLANALSPHQVKLRGVPPGLPFVFDARTLRAGLNFTFITDIGSIDILGEAPGVSSFQALWERATVVDLPDMQVRIASIEDLIAMKQAANRTKDQSHLVELVRLRDFSAASLIGVNDDNPRG